MKNNNLKSIMNSIMMINIKNCINKPKNSTYNTKNHYYLMYYFFRLRYLISKMKVICNYWQNILFFFFFGKKFPIIKLKIIYNKNK